MTPKLNSSIRLDVSVEECTTPNPFTASQTTSVEELERLMKENGIRHIPIVRGRDVVGIVRVRDLTVVMGLRWVEKQSVRATDIKGPRAGFRRCKHHHG